MQSIRRMGLALAIVTMAALVFAAGPVGSGRTAGRTITFAPQLQVGPHVPRQVAVSTSGCLAIGVIHCYTPSDVTAAYGVDAVHSAGWTGAGQTIVVVDSYGSPTAQSDLDTFSDAFGLPRTNLTIYHPCGTPSFNPAMHGIQAGWAFETSLDLQWAHAIAPDANIVLIAANPAETQGVQGLPCMFKGIEWATSHYPGAVISQSFGTTEQAFHGAAATLLPSFHHVYEDAVAAGMTPIAAAGDWGTANFDKQGRAFSSPTVIYPASDPLVTAAGGTWLQYGWTWDPTISAQQFYDCESSGGSGCLDSYLHWVSGERTEAVWKEDWLPASTGGGLSSVFSEPSYQSGLPSSLLQGRRGIPDVSWNAAVDGGVLTYIGFLGGDNNGFYIIGGTSASTPELAGVVALANQARAADGKGPVGALNPVLYALPSSDYLDIVPETFGTGDGVVTLDDNQLYGTVAPGMDTTAGYDLTTGLGSPVVPAFVAGLEAAP
jgi:subtilase family serine protease